MAAFYPLHIEAGATFERQFEYAEEDGTLFDLTGYTATVQIREKADTDLVLEIMPEIDVPSATISLVIPAESTSLLVLPRYVWAMEITAPGGEPVIRLVEGKVLVSPEVVRE